MPPLKPRFFHLFKRTIFDLIINITPIILYPANICLKLQRQTLELTQELENNIQLIINSRS